MIKSSLRLFKALPLAKKKYNYDSSIILKRTLSNGYIFSPKVLKHFPKSRMDNICSLVESEIILNAEEMNSTFHKSWNKVKTAPYSQLVLEQVFHYITTYGYEMFGTYDEDLVYIPNEKLEIPDFKEDVPLLVIKGYTEPEIKEKLLKLLGSGIALAEDTKNDVIEVIEYVGGIEIDPVKNKEVKMFLYKKYSEVPNNPIEFLRYAIYDSTKRTLLIKDKQTIEDIKESSVNSTKLFEIYEEAHGYTPLASIFYRFKPLFLAFRKNDLKPVINKIRKLAKNHHSPMKEDYLNTVTNQIKNNTLKYHVLREELSKVNIFRKIRLAYALKYRTLDVDSIVYKIRNGKGFVDSFSFDRTPMLGHALDVIIKSIVEDVAKNVDGKTIYIPKIINYTLPYTEKQFTGQFPSGTSIVVPKDLIFGINWKNQNERRTDLDLSLISTEGKIGWDGSYRNEGGEVLFSGDVTDAKGKNGATELFYIKRKVQENYLVHVNYYNYEKDIPVPYKIITAKKELQSLTCNYMIDPNNVIAIANSKIDKTSTILGVVSVTTKECKFYFTETSTSNAISAKTGERAMQSKDYFIKFYKNAINLEDMLKKAGANIIREIPVGTPEEPAVWNPDIDLSPEKLEKDTILDLLI